ncbi:DUF4043 family protein [Comamonas thiooxydans]|uniref:phage capsid family protein n=1 Tax=Comamonas thiooxydans TaxID=363952 RepID=UPI0001BB112A|nr:DUF4043 family protein [Comamonas thiooxydans]ACY32200.1 hypothetical protein CtCNB1_1454 [Comamonas thiooxydans]
MRTLIGVNDPQAVKKWASLMAVAINKESYWSRKFVGNGKDSRLPIQRIDDLQQGAGDEVTVDLLMPINQEPIIGDETLEGKEAPLKYYTDRLRIDPTARFMRFLESCATPDRRPRATRPGLPTRLPISSATALGRCGTRRWRASSPSSLTALA